MRLLSFVILGMLLLAAASNPATGQQLGISIESKPNLGIASFYPNSWALVIGINRYQRAPGLGYAVADARAVASALPGLGFSKANIRLLLDGDATKAKIETVLYEEFASMGPQDRLLVFFAGHGETIAIKGGEEGYILPVDANPTVLARTAIPMDDVRRIGQRVKAKHVLFVMDACFSGFAATRDVTPRAVTDEYLLTALREPAIQVLTAGRKGERAIEDGGHGLFTRRFLDGLRGLADADGRGIITAAQLAAWIEPRVARDSKGRMTPQYSRLDGEGQFVFIGSGSVLSREQPAPQTPQREPVAGEPPMPMLPSPQLPTVASIAIPPGERAVYPLIATTFVGVDADKVGRGYMSRPNGEPDGHIRLVIDPGIDRARVIGIEVYTSDHRGRPAFGIAPAQHWTTTGPGWFLGVERDGQRLNPSDRSIQETIRQPVAYDLYADGKDWFVSGQHFTVLVSFGDGTKRMKLLQLP